jgi:hypothetical protein
MVVFDEAQLRLVLKNYASYYNQVRTHCHYTRNAPDFSAPAEARPIAVMPILSCSEMISPQRTVTTIRVRSQCPLSAHS